MFSSAAEPVLRGREGVLLAVAEIASRPKWPLGNRDRFWRAVDAVTSNDPVAARLSERIERKQRQLQRVVSERGWHEYLEVEELQAERTLRWIELVATWARAHRSRRRRQR